MITLVYFNNVDHEILGCVPYIDMQMLFEYAETYGLTVMVDNVNLTENTIVAADTAEDAGILPAYIMAKVE